MRWRLLRMLEKKKKRKGKVKGSALIKGLAHGAEGLRDPGPCAEPLAVPSGEEALKEREARSAHLSSSFKYLSKKDFVRLSGLVTRECGIKMPEAKKTLLEARLRKRLRALDMDSFKEYCDYLFSDEGMKEEVFHMIDMVTTNKTDFFREPAHFEYLTGSVLPEMMDKYGSGTRVELKLWSAGCSTGEEPYTLAMVLSDFAAKHEGFKFNILATDVSMRVLRTAMQAVYRDEKIEPVPMEFRKRYLMRSRDHGRKLVKISPGIRSHVTFKRLNFMEDDFSGIPKKLDIIFFRNVLIYFNRDTQEALLKRFTKHLRTGGTLFVGHSETLSGLSIPSLVQEKPTVYRKT